MGNQENDYAGGIRRELLVLAAFLLLGLTLLPIAVFLVGRAVFGDYPEGLAGFFREIWGSLLAADPGTWLLVLSPYLVWLTARLTWRGLRRPTKAADV